MTFNSHNLRGGGRIFDAIDHDDVALVRKLAGDPLEFAKRRNRMSPLMYAAYASRLEAVHVLLEAGADPNEIYLIDPAAIGTFEGARRHDRFTPLHFCLFYHGDPAIAEALVRAGARLDSVSATGWIPVALAERRGRTQAAEVLREYGASKGMPDSGKGPAT